jgi:hypothetical protein
VLVDDSGEVREAFMDMTAGTVGVVEIRVLVAVGIVEQNCKPGHSHARHGHVIASMSGLISSVAWVRRGVSVQHPSKYVLDDKELERVSNLARIKLEDARLELERAHHAAKSMDRAEGDEADDGSNDEDSWAELVSVSHWSYHLADFHH